VPEEPSLRQLQEEVATLRDEAAEYRREIARLTPWKTWGQIVLAWAAVAAVVGMVRLALGPGSTPPPDDPAYWNRRR
jgi:hypothetical protein